MADAILIFTFGPIQSFIAEARRTADLKTGSQILVQLAQAAGHAIEKAGGTLVYPADLAGDAPNVLVAQVPFKQAKVTGEAAEAALWKAWDEIAQSAYAYMSRWQPRPDQPWRDIWQRQVAGQWETFWAAAEMAHDQGYAAAYAQAKRALDADKRTRTFDPAEETGRKDVLSGRRAALRTAAFDAPEYWAKVATQTPRADLRPEGRERLDAIGVIKRFSDIARNLQFASTSTIASADFVASARLRSPNELAQYQEAVRQLLGPNGYYVASGWPYDGDLLYREGLDVGPLLESYGLEHPNQAFLTEARAKLAALYKTMGWRPASYYALVSMDGDGMGARISAALKTASPAQAHINFSRQLSQFAQSVPALLTANQHLGYPIYCGGDDVLVFTPLRYALETAQVLAQTFKNKVGGSLSAGIAIAHHTYPLDAAVRAAQQAEHGAKQVPDKAAVCVRVLKRSGETVEMRSHWDNLDARLGKLVQWFAGDTHGGGVSSKLPYDLAQAAFGLPQPDDKWQAEVKRLLSRHQQVQRLTGATLDAAQEAADLRAWAIQLPDTPQTNALADWVGLARFIASHGGD
jgi:CRISPR-associated protein Cmr2